MAVMRFVFLPNFKELFGNFVFENIANKAGKDLVTLSDINGI